MGVQIRGVVSGNGVCCTWVLCGGTRSQELAFAGQVGGAVVRLSCCPCLVGAGQGFPIVRGAGEIIGG